MFRYAALLFILCGVDVSRFVLLVCDMFSFPVSVRILFSSPNVLMLFLLLAVFLSICCGLVCSAPFFIFGSRSSGQAHTKQAGQHATFNPLPKQVESFSSNAPIW